MKLFTQLGRRFCGEVPHLNAADRAHLHLKGTITGPGKLHFGHAWPDSMPLPSSLVLRDDSRITVKSHFKIYSGAIVQLARGAYLELGEGFINNEARISCAGEIIIGNGVAIAAQSVLMDKNHHQISGGKPEVGRIIIEDNVWIGIRATILFGVTIGEGAVVAAGAVVTRNIPPRTFCAGVPARVIRDATWA